MQYVAHACEPGIPQLRAEHEGFKSVVQQGVVLAVGGSTTLDVTVQVGSVTEAVTVTAAEPLIETASANLSRVVGQRTIENLPILGRNFVDFALLSSGVSTGKENRGGGAFKEPDTGVGQAAAPRLSFAAQPELNTMILVDEPRELTRTMFNCEKYGLELEQRPWSHRHLLACPSIALLSVLVVALPAAADKCSDLSNLKLPAVASITAASVPANSFTPPPPFPGMPAGPPVSVAFCRVRI